jgi:hypothetical protein
MDFNKVYKYINKAVLSHFITDADTENINSENPVVNQTLWDIYAGSIDAMMAMYCPCFEQPSKYNPFAVYDYNALLPYWAKLFNWSCKNLTDTLLPQQMDVIETEYKDAIEWLTYNGQQLCGSGKVSDMQPKIQAMFGSATPVHPNNQHWG